MIIFLSAVSDDKKFDFDELYHKYKNLVWALICRSGVTDTGLQEDIMQEVFVKLYLSLGRFQSENAIKRWLVVVTKNTLIDMNRKESNFRRYMDISIEDEDIFESCVAIAENKPLEAVLKNELRDEIIKAVNELKPIHYDVIVLHYFFEFTPKEIARMLDVSPDTVYSRLSRARSILYSAMGGWIKKYYTDGGV